MTPKCKNCKHRLDHPEGIICETSLNFVDPDYTCVDWENDDLFNPAKVVAFTIITIGIVILCANFL